MKSVNPLMTPSSSLSLQESCQSTVLHAALCEQIYLCASMWPGFSMLGKVQNPVRRISVHIHLCLEKVKPDTSADQTYRRLLHVSTVHRLLPPRYSVLPGTILWKLQYESEDGEQFLALIILQIF